MTFQKGNRANPGGKPKQKPFADALRYIGMQPYISAQRIGFPKKMTVLQAAARTLFLQALEGNVSAIKEIADRVDGKIAQSIPEYDYEPAPIQNRDVSLKEVARIMASLMLSQHQEAQDDKLLLSETTPPNPS